MNPPTRSSLPRKKVLIVDSNNGNNLALQAWFEVQPDFELLGAFHSPQLALRSPLILETDLALVGIDIPNGVKFCQILRQKKPTVGFIALVSNLEAETTNQIKQSGAEGKLVRGAPAVDVSRILRFVPDKPTLCSIVGVGGSKEGIGSTLMTCTLGAFFGEVMPGKVVLIDLDNRLGSLAFSFGLSADQGIQALLNHDEFLNPVVLQNYLKKTSHGFSILPSTASFDPKPFSGTALTGLMAVLGNFFELIIIDLPPYPFRGLEEVVDLCDGILFNVGMTSSQLKVFQMVRSDLKTLAESFSGKLTLFSWFQDPAVRETIAKIIPTCIFLPKPREAQFADPHFSIATGPEMEPLRESLGQFLDQIPVLALYSGILEAGIDASASSWGAASNSPLVRFVRSLFGK